MVATTRAKASKESEPGKNGTVLELPSKSNSTSSLNSSAKDEANNNKQTKASIGLLDELQLQGDIAFLGLQFINQDITRKKTQKMFELLKSKGFEILLFDYDKESSFIANSKRQETGIKSSPENSIFSYILDIRLSNNAFKKTAFRFGIPGKPMGEYTMGERMKVLQIKSRSALKIISKFCTYQDVLLVHDTTQLHKNLKDNSLKNIFEYFGSEVALYFGWMEFYNSWLLIPAILGVALYILQLYTEKVDHIYVLFYCIFLGISTTLFIIQWKARSNELLYEWNIYDDSPSDSQKEFEVGLRKELIDCRGYQVSDKRSSSKNENEKLNNADSSLSIEHGAKDAESRKVNNYNWAYQVFFSLPFHFICLYGMIRVVLFLTWWLDVAEEMYGKEEWFGLKMHVPLAFYCVVPTILSVIYNFLSDLTTEGEEHYDEDVKSSIKFFKFFLFHFINCYVGLCFYAFWKIDMQKLHYLLMMALVVKQLFAQFVDMLLTLMTGWTQEVHLTNGTFCELNVDPFDPNNSTKGIFWNFFKKIFCKFYISFVFKRSSIKFNSQNDNSSEIFIDTTAKGDQQGSKEWNNILLVANADIERSLYIQRNFSQLNVRNEYIESLTQYGFVVLFATAFPLAPLLAYFNSLWEIRLGIHKLQATRRPFFKIVKNTQNVVHTMHLFSFISTITNCILVVILTKSLQPYMKNLASHVSVLSTLRFPSKYFDVNDILLGLILEHLLIFIKIILHLIVPQIPKYVKDGMKKRRLIQRAYELNGLYSLSSRANKFYSQNICGMVPGNGDEGETGNGTQKGSVALAVGHQVKGEIKDLVKSLIKSGASYEGSNLHLLEKTKNELEGIYLSALSPYYILPLFALPAIMEFYGKSQLICIPIAFFYLGWLHQTASQAKHNLALSLANDPDLIKLITGYLPAWYKESDVTRPGWLNSTIARLWNSLSHVVNHIVMVDVQKILNAQKPSNFTALNFEACSLGSISPKVNGIKFIETEQNLVRLDIDISWAGDASATIFVGLEGASIPITLSNIQFHGKLRVELNPIINELPCFGAIVATFLEEPFINFKFKVGGLDVMALGAAEASVAKVVRGIIINAMKDSLLYPKQLVIPLSENIDNDEVSGTNIIGTLEVNIIRCKNLKIADYTSSDPYVVAKYGYGEEKKTRTIQHTLNPEFNEHFKFTVRDRSENINFHVFDWDAFSSDDSLGTALVNISELEDNQLTEYELHLCGVKTGVLIVTLKYCPLKNHSELDLNELDEIMTDSSDEDEDIEIDDHGSDFLEENLLLRKKKGKNLLSSVGNKVVVAGRVIKNLGRQVRKETAQEGLLTISNIGIRRDISAKAPSYGLEARFVVGHSIESVKISKIAQTNLVSDVLHLNVSDPHGQLDIIIYKVQLYRKQRIGRTFILLEDIEHSLNSCLEQEVSIPYKGINFMVKMKIQYREIDYSEEKSPKKIIQPRQVLDEDNQNLEATRKDVKHDDADV